MLFGLLWSNITAIHYTFRFYSNSLISMGQLLLSSMLFPVCVCVCVCVCVHARVNYYMIICNFLNTIQIPKLFKSYDTLLNTLFLIFVLLLVLLSKIEGTALHVVLPDTKSLPQLLSLLLTGLCHLVCSPEVKVWL